MRDAKLFPISPDPSWYERYWLEEDSAGKTLRRTPRRMRNVALLALACFSVAAACGAGVGHFHLLAP